MKGDDWHHYVIGRGSSKVEGKKTGTIKEATEHTKKKIGTDLFFDKLLRNVRNGSLTVHSIKPDDSTLTRGRLPADTVEKLENQMMAKFCRA
jgi:hypothetical protein